MRFARLLVMLVVVTACSSTPVVMNDAATPMDAAPVMEAGSDSGADVVLSCDDCEKTRCPNVAAECANNPGTWTCSASKICRENLCATECATVPATCGNIIPDPPSCTDATRKACCAEMTACGQSEECIELIYLCIDGMGCAPGSACFTTCKQKWPNGAKIFDALDKCSFKVSC